MGKNVVLSGRAVAQILQALLLITVTWFGINAVWGLTSSNDTTVSSWQRGLGPLEVWIASVLAVLILMAVSAVVRRDRGRLVASSMLLAYTLGVLGSELLQERTQPLTSLVHRSFLLLPAIPMLAVCKIVRLESVSYPLRFGDWSVKTSILSDHEFTWSRQLRRGVLYLGLPAFLLMQLSVGFSPISTGKLFPVLPTILALSLLNAFTEELLFRGLILPPFVAWLGRERGMWLQALLFGFLHFGASPSLIADLPMSVILVLLGVLFAKSALETGGLGWAISLHAVLDVATLSVALIE